MSVTDSDQRRNRILDAVVEMYVSTAQPVGSEVIARKLRSSVSPATIRNVMAELEDEGLLMQPHTSAGRVPTDRGYRFYVDRLMPARRLSPEQQQQLEALIQPQGPEVNELLERASLILAQMSQQAALVLGPSVRQSRLRQVELVPLGVRKILCILVASEEMIASHVVEVEEPMSRDEAVSLGRFLNTELAGMPFTEVMELLERRLLAQTDSFYHFVKRSLDVLQPALSSEWHGHLFLEGASNVVGQPEFRKDARKAHDLLKGLEAQKPLIERLAEEFATYRAQVRIGRELQPLGLEECSIVTAPIVFDEQVMGGIGILGPKRMDYPRMAAWAEGMALMLGAMLMQE